MFDNVALDVFIGLIFIYLLYSLLTTIIMEFIAHYMQLRPRLLVKALRRMLEDNPREIFGRKRRWTILDFFTDCKEAIKRFFYPFRNLPFLESFYHHPTIKYLGESKSSSKPSYMYPGNFSQTIVQMFRGDDYKTTESQIVAISNYLFVEAPAIAAAYKKHEQWLINWQQLNELLGKPGITIEEIVKKLKSSKNNPVLNTPRKILLNQLIEEITKMTLDELKSHIEGLNEIAVKLPRKISPETLKHLQNLFKDAQFDLNQFKQRLENWFNETMERASGWYKKQTRIILLCLGLFVAVEGNVDSIKIYKTLAKDKQVREQMVSLAAQAQGKYAVAIDSIKTRAKDTTAKRPGDTTIITSSKVLTTGDSLMDATYKVLQSDMANAGSIMGLGWCTSDSCRRYQGLEATCDSLEDQLSLLKDDYEKNKDEGKASATILKTSEDSITKTKQQIDSLSNLVDKGYKKFKNKWNGWSLVGWLITALAISLGAPFWFDMLNKVMKLRGSGTKVDNTPSTTSAVNTTPAAAAPVTVNLNTNSGEEAVG